MPNDPMKPDRSVCEEVMFGNEERKKKWSHEDHIRKCFGSITDETFVRPEQRSRSLDAPRETL